MTNKPEATNEMRAAFEAWQDKDGYCEISMCQEDRWNGFKAGAAWQASRADAESYTNPGQAIIDLIPNNTNGWAMLKMYIRRVNSHIETAGFEIVPLNLEQQGKLNDLIEHIAEPDKSRCILGAGDNAFNGGNHDY